MKYLFLQLLSLFSLSLFHTSTGCWNGCSYECWNAKSYNVVSPSHFLIDMEFEKIVLTAKNSVCHISLDLSRVENVQDVTPSTTVQNSCIGEPLYESREKCHNFHHILLLPSPSGHMTIGDSATPINETVLECGSNAFDPQCTYRMRSNLTSVMTANGEGYIPPDDGFATTTSLWLSTGRLVAATLRSQAYLGMSDVPYNGAIQVGTHADWFDRSVQFVSIYEINEYIYIFFYEVADEETTQKVIYSRIARVCKNDMGGPDTTSTTLPYNLFRTFLKARMTCVSGGENGDIPFHYNELQDTFLVETEGNDGTIERSLYAVFTGPRNGPVGSAVCVYSFGEGTSGDLTLDTVFNGDYLREVGQDEFKSESNPVPLNCSTTRTVEDAKNHHLMEDTVQQTSRTKLRLQLTGYHLKKILVASVVGVDGTTHDVMFIAGTKGGTLQLLKTVYDSVQQSQYVISELELKLSEDTQEADEAPRITQMQFLGNGSSSEDFIFIGTTDALYKVPVANCERYASDCCSCVAIRDPYCAYDASNDVCVAVVEGDGGVLIQSLEDGSSDVCLSAGSVTTQPSPTSVHSHPTTTAMISSSTVTMVTSSPTIAPTLPPSLGVTTEQTSENYLWTILAGVFGFVGGVVGGIVVTAFCYKNRGRFVWSKYVGSRRPVVEHHPRNDKGASNKEPRETMASGANNMFSKVEDYERNNSEMNPHSNATAIVHIHPISNISHSETSRRDKTSGLPSPPPYTPTKPTPLPSNGACTMMSSEKESKDMPTHVKHSTPEHKLNKSPPSQFTLSTPPKTTKPPTQSHIANKSPPSQLTLSTPPKTTKPPTQSHIADKSPPSQLTLSTPPTQSQDTPFTSSQTSLQLTRQSHAQFQSYKHQYRRANSHSHPNAPPPSGQYSTLPAKRRHSSLSHFQTTPPQRPSSAEAPPTLQFSRPVSAHNLSSAPNSAPRAQRVAMATPPKQRVPHSPFSASSQSQFTIRGGVPSSPHSGTSSVGTPASACSGSSPHFKFPPPKALQGAAAAHYRRGDRARSNPNMKATGVAVEPTTNQEVELYGNNVAPRIHTIDRKSKLPNGYTHQERSPVVTTPLSPPHPDTRVIVEVDGSVVGYTDC